MKNILMVIVLLTLALLAYKIFQPESAVSSSIVEAATDTSTVNILSSSDVDDIPPTYVDSDSSITSTSVVEPILSTQAATPSFACDGRQHCSQMTSCAEATYFSNHCPNTKMDGNHDGIPCEKQWCN
ncbi:excalibur calcium-binding domain-containing protein [Psychrobacter sp. B38]|uniref:excalibur calcium-binding domain-containing protein n=1 Tax=Psychrobacter sp. B38 TaxID=3143538 RepID=UPI00320CB404